MLTGQRWAWHSGCPQTFHMTWGWRVEGTSRLILGKAWAALGSLSELSKGVNVSLKILTLCKVMGEAREGWKGLRDSEAGRWSPAGVGC